MYFSRRWSGTQAPVHNLWSIVVQIVVVVFVKMQQWMWCKLSFLCNAGVMGWQPCVCMHMRNT